MSQNNFSNNLPGTTCNSRGSQITKYLISTSAFLFVTGSVAAQANDSEDQSLKLEEVVVTAQKTEQVQRRTPVAVGVLAGDYLEDKLIADMDEIAQLIPGFAFQQENRTQTAVALRGAASLEDSPGADPAVGFFIDGVYMGNPATFDFDLLDLQRIEVLRGPQGTTFGRNVVGGAINFVTRNPDDEFTAKANLTYGSYDRLDATGSVSGPLIEDELFALASFSSRNSDGYTRNIANGKMLDQDQQNSKRVKLRWAANDQFEAVLAADHSRDKSHGISKVFLGPTAPTVGTVSANLNQANQDLDGGYDSEVWGLSSILTYSLEDGGELVSVTSYRDSSFDTAFELDGTPASVLSFTSAKTDIEEFSQELRIVNSWNKLDYIAGLYYFRQDISRLETIDEAGAPGSLVDLLLGGAQLTEVLGQNITVDSYAAFAQGTYNISDTLRATVGGRITWEEKEGNTLCIMPALQCGQVYDVPVSEDWSAFTPKFTLDADLTDDIFAYATISRGFKSGGFASGFEDPESAAVPFDPEYAWNYEVGFKTLWFDERLQVDLTGFFVEYDDLQVRFFAGGEEAGRTIVGNAGSAENKGIELEMQAKLSRSFLFWLNYTYQDAVYKTLVLEGEDFSGNIPLLTPRDSLSLGGEFTHELANEGLITVAADLSHKSAYYGTPANLPEQASEFDAIVNASITYTFPNDNWEIQLSGKNLRDERVPVAKSEFSVFALSIEDLFAGNQGFNAHFTPPKTWQLTVKFNL